MTSRRLAILISAVLVSVSGSASLARGFACAQDCVAGACSQAFCTDSTGEGFYHCTSGSLPWTETTMLSWCAGAGQPSTSAAPFAGASEIPAAPTMEVALSTNPFVGTIVAALRDDAHWATGPVGGLLHATQYDPVSGSVVHSTAVLFTGVVSRGGVNAIEFQVDIAAGDGGFSSLLTTVKAATVLPSSIHGMVTDGAMHGQVQIAASDGKTQTISW